MRKHYSCSKWAHRTNRAEWVIKIQVYSYFVSERGGREMSMNPTARDLPQAWRVHDAFQEAVLSHLHGEVQGRALYEEEHVCTYKRLMRKDVIFRKQSIQYGWDVTEDKLWSRLICKTKEESEVKENIRKIPPWWRFRGNSNTHCYLILYTIWALSLLLPVLSQNLPLKCKCRWKVY